MHKHGKWHGELIQSTKDNRELTVESTAIELKDVSGKPLGVVSIVHDITERKIAGEKLKHKEHRLLEAQRIARLGNWEWNLQTGKVFWSSEIYKMQGISEDITTLTPEILEKQTHPDDLENVKTAMSRALSEGTPVDIIYRVVFSDGTIRVIHALGSVNEVDKDGKPLIMVGTNQDITDRVKAEEMLRTSQANFQSIFNDSPVGIIVSDIEGRVVHSNSSVERMLCYSKEELQGVSFKEFTHVNDLNIEMPLVAEMIAGTRESYELEKRYIRKDGDVIWVRMIGKTIRGTHGEKLGLALVEDITEQKHTKLKLQESNERFTAVFRTINDALIISDLETGLIIEVNKAWESHWGYKAEESVGRRSTDLGIFTDVNDRKRAMEIIQDRGRLENFEVLLRTRTGELRNAVLFIEKLILPGKPLLFSIVHDITDRKKSEEEIRHLTQQTEIEKQRLQTILETTPSAVVVIEASDKRFSFMNKRALELYGTDYIGLDLETNIVSVVATRPDGTISGSDEVPASRALIKGEVVRNEEWIIHRSDGVPITVLASAAPIRNANGDIVSAIVLFEDITERKQLEAALKYYNETLEEQVRIRTIELMEKQKDLENLNNELLRSNRELESFAYITSHDLQEPLRMVTSFTQLLAQKYENQLDQNAREYIGFAVDGAKRMYELINELLRYSRITRKELVFSEVDLDEALKSVFLNLKILISEKKCSIETDDLPVVFADRSQMIQLFQNLVSNGIKFSRKPPQIKISVKNEGNDLLFSVKDNGIGIDPQHSERIFEIFKRLHAGNEYAGTGIGLAICKKIVENHGGRIWVESAPGSGSTFCFTLPRRTA
jgi:PAS domain S-box-containing protein